MAENTYKVQKKQWNKWNAEAQELFNALFVEMKENQWCFKPDTVPDIEDKPWEVISWNAAFIAACELVRIKKNKEITDAR